MQLIFTRWNAFIYHHNPWDINDFLPLWLEFTIFVTACTAALLSEPLMNLHFHCFFSVERFVDKYALHSWRSWYVHTGRREDMEEYPCACAALCAADTCRLQCSDGLYFTWLIENMGTLATMWHVTLPSGMYRNIHYWLSIAGCVPMSSLTAKDLCHACDVCRGI